MEIIFDYTINNNGELDHKHMIETTPGKYPKFSHPVLGDPKDVMHLIKAFHTGAIPVAGSGWDEPTNHPGYPGKTRLQALIGEIIRLNDVDGRTILGV